MSRDNIKDKEQQDKPNQREQEGNLDQEAVQAEPEDQNPEATLAGEQEDEEVLEEYKADLEKEKDKFLRLFAEFENYKRRTAKERSELFKTAGQDVMIAMLPILDDFERASSEIAKAKDKNLSKGVELIQNKLRETLRAKGLVQMEVKEGDAFDAEIHEAITQIAAPKDSLKGKVVDVVERGYKLGDKIIRFPKVVVGN